MPLHLAARCTGVLLTASVFLGSVQAAVPAPAPATLTLTKVPIVYQGYNDCGPASIAMVLGYYGISVPVTQISRLTKATAASYMRVAAIGRYVGQYGLETAVVTGGRTQQLQRLVALGVPTIVLQYYVEVGRVPHFRVVRGFDQIGQWMYLADPLIGYARIQYRDFELLWGTQGRTFAAVYPAKMRPQVLKALRS